MLRILLTLLVVSLLACPAMASDAVDWSALERQPDQALDLLEGWRDKDLSGGDRLRWHREYHAQLNRDGRNAEALAASQRWVGFARDSTIPDALPEALLAHGQSLLAMDRLDEAARSLSEAQSLVGPDGQTRFAFAAMLGLADVARRQGDYAEATAQLDQAELLWQEDPAPAEGARLWTMRAGIAFRQFRKREALTARMRAAEQARLAEDPVLLFQSLTNLARAHLDLEDYAAAIPLFIETSGLESRPLDQVVNRLQMGISHFELNQFSAARRQFEAARESASRLDSPALEGVALGELGLTAWSGDQDPETALQYYDAAIALMSGINDRVNAAVWRSNKAVVLRDSGRLEEALELYQQLVADLAGIEGQQVWPAIYKGLGQTQIALGQYGPAEQSLQLCLDGARTGADAKRIWECEHQRARLLAIQGNIGEAKSAFEAALAEIERVRVSLLLGRFKADFFENKLGVYQDYLAMLAREFEGEAGARQSFELAERARARAFLDDLAQAGRSSKESIAEDLLLREEQLLKELWRLQLLTDPASVKERARLESELDRVSLAALRQAGDGLPQPGPVTLEEIQAALDAGERILAYWLAEPESRLWVVTPDSIDHFELPGGSEIEALVRAAYGQLSDPAGRPELTALGSALLGPLLETGESMGSLLIVPSGILHYFPFETLPTGKQGLLADRAITSYWPSASALVKLRARPARKAKPRLLAVGGVNYAEAPAASPGSRAAGLGPLPYSGEEVRFARDRFVSRASTLLTGAEALESHLKGLPLASYSVLHFATHGRIDEGSQAASGLLFARESEGEDGLLQTREIQQLDLNADLVNLSACQSGLGRLVTGEGMVGLTRGFMDAGARSVVASLWSVNDRASALFMDAFYRELGRGAGRAEALSAARRHLRQRPGTSHPYYWAPWVLTGEGRDGVAFPFPWYRWLVALGLLLGLAALGLWWRVQRSSRKSVQGDSAKVRPAEFTARTRHR